MKYLKILTTLLGCLTLVAGCSGDPVQENGDGDDSGIDDGRLVSELEEDEVTQVCDEVEATLHEDMSDEGFCSLFVAWGAGESDDPVQTCNEMWDDCMNEEEGWERPDGEEFECPREAMAECDAEVGTYRGCSEERITGLETAAEVFECSLMDEDEEHEDVQTFVEAGEKYTGEGETCSLLKEECEELHDM